MKRFAIAVTILVAVAAAMLLGAGYEGSSNLAVRNQQNISQIQHGTAGTVWFVAIGGNDAKNGLAPERAKLSPKTVIEAALAYDVVVIGPGTFALGANQIVVPANVTVNCAGMDVTVLTSTADYNVVGAIVVPGDNSAIRDVTILDAGGTANSQVGIGSEVTTAADPLFTNALVERVKVVTDKSAIRIAQGNTACTLTARDCIFVAPDTIHISSDTEAIIDLVNCEVIAEDDATLAPDGIRAEAGLVRAWNCRVSVTTAQGTATGVMGNGGIVEMHGGSIYVTAATTIRSVWGNGGEVILSGVEYNGSQEVAGAGTITRSSPLMVSSGTMVTGVVGATDLAATTCSSDLSEATDDHYNGRIIVFTSGALKNQATDITDYENTNGVLTFTATTDGGPSEDDTFIIL